MPIKDERLNELVKQPFTFTPENDDEMKAALESPMWRLSHLYQIMIKGDDEDEDDNDVLVQTFVPNEAQLHFINNYHFRTIILKARQLGFTTFVSVYFLDCALFRKNIRAGMIAQTGPIAQRLFRDKVKFAYENLPVELLEIMPLKRDSAEELLFAHNGSSIWVSTSMRGGTLQYLHVSEFGKICADFPVRAEEVIKGALPAVPKNGIVIIESTAEGREGWFYKMVMRAQALLNKAVKLAPKQFKLLFYPWWKNKEYRVDPQSVVITEDDHEYFDKVEGETGIPLTLEQRAWYVFTRDEDFSGDIEAMYQEYPSTSEEPFLVSALGTYYAQQIALARKQKRIRDFLPVAPGVPCITCWDIGNSDGTAIWVTQQIGPEIRVVDFIEGWGEPYSYFAKILAEKEYIYDRHLLPHDATHQRQGQKDNKSPEEMLQELMPGHRFDIVPRIEDVNWGIQQTRDLWPELMFDESKCKNGLIHLQSYKKKWNERQQVWSDQPDKSGGHSEAADALRQLGQAKANGQLAVYKRKPKKKRNWRTS